VVRSDRGQLDTHARIIFFFSICAIDIHNTDPPFVRFNLSLPEHLKFPLTSLPCSELPGDDTASGTDTIPPPWICPIDRVINVPQ